MNPVQRSIPQADGSNLQVIIELILEKDGKQGLRSNGVFKAYYDALGDETHLFIEPAESDEPANDLPDEHNPDHLGKFVFRDDRISKIPC